MGGEKRTGGSGSRYEGGELFRWEERLGERGAASSELTGSERPESTGSVVGCSEGDDGRSTAPRDGENSDRGMSVRVASSGDSPGRRIPDPVSPDAT